MCECTDIAGEEAGSLLTEVLGSRWMYKSLGSREMKQSGIERVERRHEQIKSQKFLVAMRLGDTPVPIPNTMVKT